MMRLSENELPGEASLWIPDKDHYSAVQGGWVTLRWKAGSALDVAVSKEKHARVPTRNQGGADAEIISISIEIVWTSS